MKLRRWLLRVVCLLMAVFSLVWWGVPWCLALPEALSQPYEPSVRFLDHAGKPLRQLLTADGLRRGEPMLLENIPLALQQATLAAEDRRFRWHGGVDPLAIARALWDNLKAGRVVSGASTIHQQLIKITSSKPASRTLVVKIREAWLARRLAMAWSRDRVLQEYLNRLPYGNLQTGCVAAAAGYFDKPLADLSVAECALLAAIPQSPTRLNPYRNLEALPARRHLPCAATRGALPHPMRWRCYAGGLAGCRLRSRSCAPRWMPRSSVR
jgi:penicillin-binding protein 1C